VGNKMFENIKQALQNDDITSLSSQEKYYAYQWLEEGRFEGINVSNKCYSELITFMCMNF
jgi:hypothetical protein